MRSYFFQPPKLDKTVHNPCSGMSLSATNLTHFLAGGSSDGRAGRRGFREGFDVFLFYSLWIQIPSKKVVWGVFRRLNTF